MHSEILENQKRDRDPAYLLITDANAQTSIVDLEENSRLFVGTGAHCRIVLDGSTVHSIHCLIWMDENQKLRVQDWNTDGLTIVNGQPIDDVTLLNSGDKLLIGTHLIVPVLSSEFHAQVVGNFTVSDEAQNCNQSPNCNQSHNVPMPDLAEALPDHCAVFADADVVHGGTAELNLSESNSAYDPHPESTNDSEIQSEFAPLRSEVLALPELDDTYELESDFDIDADFENECSGHDGFGDSNSFESGMDNEELELLLNEVDQLRYEVADRDSQIRLLTERGRDSESEDEEDDEQTVRLVNRLEELLHELQSTDDRARGLEELLRVSDQATQAEQEERVQLESWLTEIEQRITQRESESSAEIQRSLSRIKDAEARREHAESQFKKILHSQKNGSGDLSNELLKKLTEQNEVLQKQLIVAQQEKETLQAECANAVRSASAQEELQQMEAKLLQVQVDASREHAELARQRAQLERLKDELQQKLSSTRELGEADSRIRAMREHLKEIHQQEQEERDEKRQRSLGGRIANLLNRVGRV